MPFLSSVLGSCDSVTCPTQDLIKRLPNHNCHTHYNPLEDRTTKKIMPERERDLWLIHAVVWQNPTQYCKAIIPQLKI